MAPITTWYGENLYENEEIETFGIIAMYHIHRMQKEKYLL